MRYVASKVVRKTEASKAQRVFAAQQLRRFAAFITGPHHSMKVKGSEEYLAGLTYAYKNTARLALMQARNILKERKR